MENKLFVGSLAWATSDESLTEAFSAAGEVVSAKVITDRETGRSRGFGFVEMATPEDAQAAIEMWNDKDLDGRSIRVSIAKARDDRE